jgi:hypothetical protein
LQQEAEFQERDFIIPWPIVAAIALFVAFGIVEALLIGRGATPVDRMFAPSSTSAGAAGVRLNLADDARAYVRSMLLAYLNRDFMGPLAASTVSAILIACAFVEKSVGVQVLFGGFAGGVVRRKKFLLQGEVLAGIAVVLWAVQLLSRFALRPDVNYQQPIPHEFAVAPIAFWGTLAYVAWSGEWLPFWRYLLSVAFAGGVVFEIWFLLAHGIYATTIVASPILGMAIFVLARWCLEKYCN